MVGEARGEGWFLEVLNAVGEAGAQSLARSLLSSNSSLVALDLNFNGVAPGTQELIRGTLRRNYRKMSKVAQDEVRQVLYPPHLTEVLSVYRLGGEYKGDPDASASVWEGGEADPVLPTPMVAGGAGEGPGDDRTDAEAAAAAAALVPVGDESAADELVGLADEQELPVPSPLLPSRSESDF